jgi:hypothetical protein
MKILDRLPIPNTPTLAVVGTETVPLKKSEIIVWVSLSPKKAMNWNPAVPRFPAILDTGHTHNFAIQNQHLERWTGISAKDLRRIGHIRHTGAKMPLFAANLWLHRNFPGECNFRPEAPFPVDLAGSGICVFPDEAKYPRLPLVGLRAILGNQLHLTIDGERASVTLRIPDWRTRAMAWLT